MQQIDVPPDGDCLFSSVVMHPKQMFAKDSNSDLIQQLSAHGIDVHNCNVQSLRCLLVDEWIANKVEYEPFYNGHNIDFDVEAEKYRNLGMYTTSFSDAMLLGLSTALRLQIIVFTSIPS